MAWETLPDRLYEAAEILEDTPTGDILIEATDWILDAQHNINADDLACKQYIKRTESRIEIHNGNSE